MLPTYDMLYGGAAEKFFKEHALQRESPVWGGDSWPIEASSAGLPSKNVLFVDRGSAVVATNSGALALISIGDGWFNVRVAGDSQTQVDTACAAFRQAYPASYLTQDNATVPITFWANSKHGPIPRLRRVESAQWGDIEQNYTSHVRDSLGSLMAWDAPETVDGQLLLWQGQPGTGKSWALRALASQWAPWAEFHYITDPDSFFVDDPSYMINVLLADSYDMLEPVSGDVYAESNPLGKWRVLILEDTGELLSATAKEKYGQGLSRLLNVVDGMIGQGLRVLALVTTNDELGTLHPAVTRPGRCASQIEFLPMTADEVAAWAGEDAVEGATLAELYARKNNGAEAITTDDEAMVAAAHDVHAGVMIEEIAVDAQEALNAYWAEHEEDRVLEGQETGFDPVDQALQYWHLELAEPIHSDVAARVEGGDEGVFTLPNVERWIAEEAEEKQQADETAAEVEFATLLELATQPLELEGDTQNLLSDSPDVSALVASLPHVAESPALRAGIEALAASHKATTEGIASLVASAHTERTHGTGDALALTALGVLREFASRPAPAAPQLGDIHVHVPQHDLAVTVEGSKVEPRFDVHMPVQPAPVANVTVHVPEQAAAEPSPIIVNVPEQKIDVHVPAAQVDVHVTTPEPVAASARRVRVEYDAETGAKSYVTEDAT
jgi:hypothetical protein